MFSIRISLLVALVCSFSACSNNPPTQREAGAVGGAVVGAGLGAIVGSQVGNTGAGVAIGGAAGAITGGLVGNALDKDEDVIKQQEEILRRQQQEIDRQRRELDDLKRQRYQNDELKNFEGAVSPREVEAPAAGEDFRRY